MSQLINHAHSTSILPFCHPPKMSSRKAAPKLLGSLGTLDLGPWHLAGDLDGDLDGDHAERESTLLGISASIGEWRQSVGRHEFRCWKMKWIFYVKVVLACLTWWEWDLYLLHDWLVPRLRSDWSFPRSSSCGKKPELLAVAHFSNMMYCTDHASNLLP